MCADIFTCSGYHGGRREIYLFILGLEFSDAMVRSMKKSQTSMLSAILTVNCLTAILAVNTPPFSSVGICAKSFPE